MINKSKYTSERDSLNKGLSEFRFNYDDRKKNDDVLVVIFLRGAADGLNMIVPYGEDAYYKLRPTLSVPRPDDKSVEVGKRAIDLDGFFGLHPNLEPLYSIWKAENLAIVHASGAPDDSHSHFKSMNLMERGITNENGSASGWLSRHLVSKDTANPSPLRAVGIGNIPQRSLRGAIPVTAFNSIDEFQLNIEEESSVWLQSLVSLYYKDNDVLGKLGKETLRIFQTFQKLDIDAYELKGDLIYPDTKFGSGLKQIAMLIKADVGLEAVALDHNNWDTHFAQGLYTGLMPGLLSELAIGLAAFLGDLHDYINRLSVIVMSEFGRRAYENGSLGTDHGHGEAMLLLGGNINGKKVYTDWPGLEKDQLYGPGDLAVTTDYRDILSELCLKRLGNPHIESIFPNFNPVFRNVFKG